MRCKMVSISCFFLEVNNLSRMNQNLKTVIICLGKKLHLPSLFAISTSLMLPAKRKGDEM